MMRDFFFFWKEKARPAWVWGQVPVHFCLAQAVSLQSPSEQAARGRQERERAGLASLRVDGCRLGTGDRKVA